MTECWPGVWKRASWVHRRWPFAGSAFTLGPFTARERRQRKDRPRSHLNGSIRRNANRFWLFWRLALKNGQCRFRLASLARGFASCIRPPYLGRFFCFLLRPGMKIRGLPAVETAGRRTAWKGVLADVDAHQRSLRDIQWRQGRFDAKETFSTMIYSRGRPSSDIHPSVGVAINWINLFRFCYRRHRHCQTALTPFSLSSRCSCCCCYFCCRDYCSCCCYI